jgi:hypothetical protein
MAEERSAAYALLVEVELPDFNTEGLKTDEDAEVAMDLANHMVTVTFAVHEGDNPGVVLKAMAGRVVNVSLVS